MKYLISDIDKVISGYESKFKELKTALLEGIAVQTGVTVVHMMNVITHTGTSDMLRLQ